MTPDIIVSWPRNTDFPLWRAFIAENRRRFADIHVIFTEHDGPDLSYWVAEHFPNVWVHWTQRAERDWRDVAVNAGLAFSSADWIWFTEQDFLIHSPERFWRRVADAARHNDALGIREPVSGRWHPACLFARRTAIDRTSRYFGPEPVDHFYRFGTELGFVYDLQQLAGLRSPDDFEHLQGTSQNHWLIDNGTDEGVFRRLRFRAYLRDCLTAGVPLQPDWERRALREVA